ncbi:MAG: 16S rRNA (guanine(527)-N(7))-methyltransferase RsmG, partial [Synergistaceae bacterium]|nr:16S rRNA (guanine(527)-N(7))-methyltransferase RsmG [Synergistaceae bacterium]
LVARGGRAAAFKGPKGVRELEEVGDKWNAIGFSSPTLLSYGSGERDYFFVVWEKISPTSPSYPRKPGAAAGQNWWVA